VGRKSHGKFAPASCAPFNRCEVTVALTCHARLGDRHRSVHYSGSGFPFVSGANGNTASPSKKITHIVTPAYRIGKLGWTLA